MLSYEDAARLYAKEHKVSLAVARLAVADDYTEALTDRTSEDQTRARLDRRPLDPGVLLIHHPWHYVRGRIVPVDEPRSPAQLVAARKQVALDKLAGDWYREQSRRTSVHTIGDSV